jgi:hypothetical protein
MDKKSSIPKTENSLTLKVVLDIIEKQFTSLWKTSDNLDAKAISIMGFNGIIVSIVFSNYIIKKKAKMMNWGLCLTYVGLIFFVLSIFAREVK